MVKVLSELYGVPFERNRTRSVVIALMGGALPTGFSTMNIDSQIRIARRCSDACMREA